MKFYSSIHQFYDSIFPLNPNQVDFVQTYFDVNNAELLDVGCATGELAIELAKKGFLVSAFDLDQSMIKCAKEKSVGPNPIFLVDDMLKISTTHQTKMFDGVICFGNTLVHLTNKELIATFFDEVYSVLKPGGKFLLQLLNYDHIVKHKIESLPLIENNKVKFTRNYYFQKNGLINFSTCLSIYESHQLIKNEIELLPITKIELEHLLNDAGFTNLDVFGSFAFDKLTDNSLPLILKVQK